MSNSKTKVKSRKNPVEELPQQERNGEPDEVLDGEREELLPSSGSKLEADVGFVRVESPKFRSVSFLCTGDSPYVQLPFSTKSKNAMKLTMEQGEKAKTRRKKEPRDFQDDYEHSVHLFDDGTPGIPAMSFKNAMVRAGTLCGIPMTRSRILVHVKADGYDVNEGCPLIRFSGGTEKNREMAIDPVRNANGSADLRVRSKWREWSAVVRVEYDMTCIGVEDIHSLLIRAGRQVGIGEGRPSSKKSCGMGWGTFTVELYEDR
ncbi:MAG: hypothetical protein KGL39_00410 [Patescibacteria group bacterium]|nr:hypothetical protein [Patescibacteria group bacterium]